MPPPPPPVTEHESLHSNLLCKVWHVRLEGANNMRPLSWGGTNGKDTFFSWMKNHGMKYGFISQINQFSKINQLFRLASFPQTSD